MNTPKRTAAELTKAATLVNELKAEARDLLALGIPQELEQHIEQDVEAMYEAWKNEDGSAQDINFGKVFEAWVSGGEVTPALSAA